MSPGKVFNETLAKSPVPYKGVLIEFVDAGDGTYIVMLYKENLAEFPDRKRQEIVNWVHNFVARLTSAGVPTQYWISV